MLLLLTFIGNKCMHVPPPPIFSPLESINPLREEPLLPASHWIVKKERPLALLSCRVLIIPLYPPPCHSKTNRCSTNPSPFPAINAPRYVLKMHALKWQRTCLSPCHTQTPVSPCSNALEDNSPSCPRAHPILVCR